MARSSGAPAWSGRERRSRRPNAAAITRPVGAFPLEQPDKWAVPRARHKTRETMAPPDTAAIRASDTTPDDAIKTCPW